jgi:hypothetical protein
MQHLENLWHCVLLIIASGAMAACSAAQQLAEETAAQEQRLDQFRTAGADASITVFPAGLIGRPVREVGDAVALMLERAGVKNIEIDAPEFCPPEKADLAETAQAFGAFVKANPLGTDYALFAHFLGSMKEGPTEVRVVIVNRRGEIVWQDRQTGNDADFRQIKPRAPMECCLLVVQRLRPVLGLKDPTRDTPPGRIARRWSEKSGLPDEAERAALRDRLREFHKVMSTATLLVYPALVGDQVSQESAQHLAELFNEANLVKASATEKELRLEVPGNINEQKMLWDMARGVREFVQAHRPNTDYVLFAHYLMGKDVSGNVAVGAVHFTICDCEGQWVIVDFQNDHHGDFQAIDPKSREDCDQLVLRRLKTY